MKQTNSSLRQALEGGIDPLRPPEVRLLCQVWVQKGVLSLEVEQKGVCLEQGFHFCIFESKDYFCFFL
jgi:hypothetical protein